MQRPEWRFCFAFCLALAAAAAGSVRADSLWPRRNPQRAFLCQDSRARNVGDLVTIIVSESSEVDNSEDKSLSKAGRASGA